MTELKLRIILILILLMLFVSLLMPQLTQMMTTLKRIEGLKHQIQAPLLITDPAIISAQLSTLPFDVSTDSTTIHITTPIPTFLINTDDFIDLINKYPLRLDSLTLSDKKDALNFTFAIVNLESETTRL